MKKAILAKKIGMTQIFNGDGTLTPVTVLEAGPCVVTQVKTKDNDGYSAVQVGFEDIRESLVNKPAKGVFDKAGVSVKRYVRELKLDNAEEMKPGDEVKEGAVKRLGQHRGPMKHGSKFHRHQGSNGTSSDPSRVYKGKGMPGHMGSKRITIQNLEVVRVDAENNLLLVKGAVPGAKKCLVTIKETVKSSK